MSPIESPRSLPKEYGDATEVSFPSNYTRIKPVLLLSSQPKGIEWPTSCRNETLEGGIITHKACPQKTVEERLGTEEVLYEYCLLLLYKHK